MCDEGHQADGKWLGWVDVPEPTLTGRGPWIDLSHPLSENVPRVPIVPKPHFGLWRKMPEFPNVTEMQMIVHLGTHVDAPRHFTIDGPAFHEIPLTRLYGSGVVWRFDARPYDVIEPADLEAQKPKLKRGDILMIDTGWSERVGTEDYERHPCLTVASAEWLVDHGVKMLAIDFGTPEAAPDKRWPGWRWPVHSVLLSHGVLVAEHLRNLRPLAGQRVEAMLLGLSIEEGDGAPARAVARPAG